MEELFEAGGIPAVMKELAPLLHGECLTVTGQTVAENLARLPAPRSARTRPGAPREVVAARERPARPRRRDWPSCAATCARTAR